MEEARARADSEARRAAQLQGEPDAVADCTLEELRAVSAELQDGARRVQRVVTDREVAAAQCVVCLETHKDTLLAPCNHLSLCGGCAESLAACPIC